MSSSELLPCPFCGGIAEMTALPKAWAGEDGEGRYSVECRNCGINPYRAHTKEQAAAAWNTRHKEG